MIGYPLKNTLSDNGDVNRGICSIKDGPVSYTHLDVYKRQMLGSKRPICREVSTPEVGTKAL